MADEIKPCPFCGSRNLAVRTAWDYRHEFVTCRNCGTNGPRADDTHGAWAAWNDRKVSEPMQQRFF